MFDERVEGYKKALVIGTGGGNDIVSTLLPAQYLQIRGIQTDIAGILSPAAVHEFNGNLENVVNVIEGNIKRTILAPEEFSISFIDEHLPDFVKKVGLNVENFYDFSIRYGTAKLIDGINSLISEKNYDLVVAVDVGGDILGRGSQDSTLLSPIMDFTTLYLLDKLNARTLLVEFGLGTDGELRPEGMEEILKELKENNLLLHESSISLNDSEVQKFVEVFNRIKAIRSGHTAVMTLRTLEAEVEEDVITEYRFRSRIGTKKWLTPFEVKLPYHYAGKTYLIDGKNLVKTRKETAFSYQNSLEQQIKLKTICPSWKTELDLFYLWSGNNWTAPEKKGNSLFLLTPSTNIPWNQRKEILEYGLETNQTDLVLMLNSDVGKVDMGRFMKCDVGNFSILSREQTNLLENVATQIYDYQKI